MARTDRARFGLGLNLPYVEGSMDGETPRWADILAMAQTGESIGFDGLWISDHVGFGDPEGDWSGAWESWTLLSALAASTSRVTLGNYVLAVSFRNPALLAKMAETLDEISGGRVILGLGAGWNEPEYTSYGVPFDDEIQAVRGCPPDHHGHAPPWVVDAMTGTRSRPAAPGSQPRGPRPTGLPVMVGANGPRMLRLTAELADQWNGGLPGLDEVPGMLQDMDEACRAVGRDPTTIGRSAEVLVRTVAAPAGVAAEEARDARRPGVDRRAAAGARRLRVRSSPGPVAPEFARGRRGVRAGHRATARRRLIASPGKTTGRRRPFLSSPRRGVASAGPPAPSR